MNNFREVNDDILKDWLEFREDKIFATILRRIRSITFTLMNFLIIF